MAEITTLTKLLDRIKLAVNKEANARRSKEQSKASLEDVYEEFLDALHSLGFDVDDAPDINTVEGLKALPEYITATSVNLKKVQADILKKLKAEEKALLELLNEEDNE